MAQKASFKERLGEMALHNGEPSELPRKLLGPEAQRFHYQLRLLLRSYPERKDHLGEAVDKHSKVCDRVGRGYCRASGIRASLGLVVQQVHADAKLPSWAHCLRPGHSRPISNCRTPQERGSACPT